MYKITEIKASASGERLLLGVLSPDGGIETFPLSCEAYRELALSKGEITRAQYESLCERSEYEAVLTRALRMLGYGASSKQRLERKLIATGASRVHARRAADELSARGYIDEKKDAERLAEKLLRQNYGRRRILAHLKQRGYSDEATESADAMLAEVDFLPLCVEAIRKKYKKIPREPDEIKKAIAKLVNLGYNVNIIKEALIIARNEE